MVIFVNVYEVRLEYGGPEEGGRYYDAWEPAIRHMETDEYGNWIEGTEVYESHQCKRMRQAERIAHQLESRFPFNQKNYTSVLADRNYRVRIENHPPKAGNNYRPYE